ncbi:MAG: hypothetical protein U0X75_17060 [Acidobacteriota bacterium]
MKKFSLLLAIALLGCLVALSPVTANAQDDAQATFERTWYATCYTEKNEEKCYQQSKELLQKYPSSAYAKNATSIVQKFELNEAWTKFRAALETYYKGPDANKLEQLFSSGDNFLKIEPDQQNPYHLFALAQMALAGHSASLGQIYKNYDKVKGYAERAITEMSAVTSTPEKFKAEYPAMVDPLRDLVPANMNQFLAYQLIETKGDQDQAIAYLTKATQVKAKGNVGWKDANNYWLRANIYSGRYVELRAKYNALTDEEKTGDKGKELLKQVNEVIDKKLIPDYARVVATATDPALKELRDEARKQFDGFWKYRTDAPDKAAEFLKAFDADPTVEGPAIPVKAETAATELNAPAAPTGGANVKLSASGPGGAAPDAKGASTTKGKAAPAKKAAPKKKGRKG